MRRIENRSAAGRSAALEIALVVALLGAVLALSVLGDQLVGVVSDAIANLHAS